MAFFGETYRILSLIDLNEYKGLNGQQTKDLGLILSVSMVDLEVGAPMRNLLWDMFPAGTVSGNAFRDEKNGLVRIPPLPAVP